MSQSVWPIIPEKRKKKRADSQLQKILVQWEEIEKDCVSNLKEKFGNFGSFYQSFSSF